MMNIFFANLPELGLAGAWTYVVWQTTRWTHHKWVWEWFTKPKV